MIEKFPCKLQLNNTLTFLNIKELLTFLQSLDQMRILKKFKPLICFYCACQNENKPDKPREFLVLFWARPLEKSLARDLTSPSDLSKEKFSASALSSILSR